MLDEPRGRLLVVAADLVERRVDEAVEQDDRHALGLEVGEGVLERADGRREQHPVDLALGQRAHDPQLVLGILARVAEQQRVPGAARGVPRSAATTSVKYGFESPLIASPSDCVPPRASARAIVFGR